MRTFTTQSARAALAAKDAKIAALHAEIRKLERAINPPPPKSTDGKHERAKYREIHAQVLQELKETFPNYATDHDEFEKALEFQKRRMAELGHSEPPSPLPPPEPPKIEPPKPPPAVHDANMQPEQERIADDLLMGAPAIGKFLGMTATQVYYWHRTKKLPIGSLGKTLIASRRRLRRAIQALTS